MTLIYHVHVLFIFLHFSATSIHYVHVHDPHSVNIVGYWEILPQAPPFIIMAHSYNCYTRNVYHLYAQLWMHLVTQSQLHTFAVTTNSSCHYQISQQPLNCNHIHTEAKLMYNVTDNWLDKHGNWLNRLPWVRVHVHIHVIKIKTYTQSQRHSVNCIFIDTL